VRQIRKGVAGNKKGTAFVVYEQMGEAKTALEGLNGFNVAGKYLICLYYQQNKMGARRGDAAVKADINYLKEKYNF
jgi:pre-mRNA branch site protein p14